MLTIDKVWRKTLYSDPSSQSKYSHKAIWNKNPHFTCVYSSLSMVILVDKNFVPVKNNKKHTAFFLLIFQGLKI